MSPRINERAIGSYTVWVLYYRGNFGPRFGLYWATADKHQHAYAILTNDYKEHLTFMTGEEACQHLETVTYEDLQAQELRNHREHLRQAENEILTCRKHMQEAVMAERRARETMEEFQRACAREKAEKYLQDQARKGREFREKLGLTTTATVPPLCEVDLTGDERTKK